MARRHRIRNHAPVKNTTPGYRGYALFLHDLKHRIQAAQMKAALAVNEELIQLYWDIGRAIVQKQQQQGWGKGVVERLASDLKKAFPGISGFSASNIWRMRAFYQAYTHRPPILAQPVRELSAPAILAQPVREFSTPSRLPRTRDQTMPQPVRHIPWGHNIILIQCLTDSAAADLLRQLGAAGEIARDLAYRLYNICERRKWPSEALAYNSLVIAWPEITQLSAKEKQVQAEEKELF